jgi:tripartite-type tricarboxylate transporter receptor subunit TctC
MKYTIRRVINSTRKINRVAASMLLAMGVMFGATAQTIAADYPNGPVQLVVPFKPGGGADRTFRLFAPYLSEELGVPVNVVNISGGGGWVAWAQAVKWDAEKDDHKLQVVNLPHVLSMLDPRMKRSETLEDFNFLAWHSLDPCIWAVREGDERFQSLAEFLDFIAKNPNEVIISSTAVGSDDHMGIAFAEKNVPDFKVRKIYFLDKAIICCYYLIFIFSSKFYHHPISHLQYVVVIKCVQK